MHTLRVRSLVASFALMLAGTAAAQETTQAMVAAAVKEGKVVWYTSVDVKVAEAIAKAFRAAGLQSESGPDPARREVPGMGRR